MSLRSAVTANSFLGGTIILFAGSSIAQLISIIFSPILTRLYGPDSFGLLALFTSITSIISTICCMRYECAIVLPESDEDGANLLAGSLLIAFAVSLLLISFFPFRYELLSLLNALPLEPYISLIPIIVFINGVFVVLTYWSTRTKNFFRLTSARVSYSIITVTAQLGAGFAGHATGGNLINGLISGTVVSALVLGGQVWKQDKYLLINSISREKMLSGLKRHANFPLYDTWASLLNTISWQLPVLLLSAFFSPIVVGYYALGFRVLQTPMGSIGNSIGQVFFKHASDSKIDGNLSSLVERVFEVLFIIGIFPILMLTQIGGDVFPLIFGKAWLESGVYVQYMGIWVLIWFISSPLSTIYYVFEKQQLFLKFAIANFIARLLALYIGGYLGNARISIILFSVAGILTYGYLLYIILRLSNVSWSRIINIILKNIALFLPAGFVIFILKLFGISAIVILGVSAILCLAYYIYILKTNSEVKRIFNLLKVNKL